MSENEIDFALLERWAPELIHTVMSSKNKPVTGLNEHPGHKKIDAIARRFCALAEELEAAEKKMKWIENGVKAGKILKYKEPLSVGEKKLDVESMVFDEADLLKEVPDAGE